MRPLLLVVLLAGLEVAAQVPPRSLTTLPSANGATAVLVDTASAKVTHFREHLPASEEPQLDAAHQEVWVGNQPQVVKSRDLLYDSYFGLRAQGQQRWLTGLAVDSSHYVTAAPATHGGSGVVQLTQHQGSLSLSTFVFAPRALPHPGFVEVLCVKNGGTSVEPAVSVFTLHNFHLGYGRPGVMTDLASNGETITVTGASDVFERGFAGVIGTRPLGTARASAWQGTSSAPQNGYFVVAQGMGDLTAVSGTQPVGDDWASGFQFDLGDLAAGQEACVGSVSMHHGDPFAQATVQAWLDAFVAGRSARAVVDAEVAGWASFQASLHLPAGLSADEDQVARQSAVVLAMAQVKETQAWLREWLTKDGEARYSRFTLTDGGSTLPGEISHRGAGAMLASLPPGEWTVAWVRDGAYSAVALAQLGLAAESGEALRFLLEAEGGRFQRWNELKPYGMPPYQVSLVRYHGFGVEETDFNDFGPNLEFDGFGLTLWALARREALTGDQRLVDTHWDVISGKVAEPLVALIDPATGLVRADSSIWESHWNGRQRSWTWTNLVTVRGLCDAATLAERKGDTTHAATWRKAALALRRAIAAHLTDAQGALASNAEELNAREGYFDTAVVEAVNLGLYAPDGGIARATLDALEQHLRVDAGPGWARNDDRVDHSGANDLSPWGSEYDSAEWSFTDLRGAVALRAMGRTSRADAVLTWASAQAATGEGLMPETWDEATGAWKFNAPMVGFGAGAYLLALGQRGVGLEPACGAWFEDEVDAGRPDAGGHDAGLTDAGTSDGGTTSPPRGSGCGCQGSPERLLPLLLVLWLGTRRRG
jgi:hypothetical protein